MTLSNEQIERAREYPLFELLGIQNKGRPIMIRCPFHNERTPSCIVYPPNYHKKGYNCFGCEANGQNAIDFCIEKGHKFEDIVEELSS